jgi:hypothetical protein
VGTRLIGWHVSQCDRERSGLGLASATGSLGQIISPPLGSCGIIILTSVLRGIRAKKDHSLFSDIHNLITGKFFTQLDERDS